MLPAQIFAEIPEGYISGADRSPESERLVTHLYKGTFAKPGLPMCSRGWNRFNGTEYSIWRNMVSTKGICKVCLRRALQGRPGKRARREA